MSHKSLLFKEFPNRLERLIWARGVSPASLARTLNLSQGTLSRYLAGKQNPTPEALKRISEALEVDWRVLIGELPLPPEAAVPTDSEAPPGPEEGAGQGGRLHPFTGRTEASINEPRAGRIRRAGKTGKRI